MNKDIKRIIVIKVVNNIVTSDRTITNFIVTTVFIKAVPLAMIMFIISHRF